MPHLELREEPGGLRHYLEGEPVHAGDILEIQMPDGSWERARYEYAGTPAARAALYVRMGEHGLWMDVRPADELRWPRPTPTTPAPAQDRPPTSLTSARAVKRGGR